MAASILEAYGDLDAPALLAALRVEFSTLRGGKMDFKGAAAALGVTPRAVARWYTGASEQRKPGKKSLEQMKRILPKRFIVSGTIVIDSPKAKQRGQSARKRTLVIPADRDLDADEAAEVYDTAHLGVAGAEEAALDYLMDIFGFHPDFLPEVDEMDISIEL